MITVKFSLPYSEEWEREDEFALVGRNIRIEGWSMLILNALY